MSDAEVTDVEAWIASYKAFDHYFPGWKESKGRCDWQASWPIVDAHGIASAVAYFEADASLTEISISIVFRRAPVYRLDKINEAEPEGNQLSARQYAPHSASRVFRLSRPWLGRQSRVGEGEGVGRVALQTSNQCAAEPGAYVRPCCDGDEHHRIALATRHHTAATKRVQVELEGGLS